MNPIQRLSSSAKRQKSGVIKSTCRLCYNGCGVLVQVENGHPIRIMGNPDHPLSKGTLCPRGRSALELLDHLDRLRYPLKRSGPRGAGCWTRITWDEVLDEIIHALDGVRQRLGPQAVVFMCGRSKGTSNDHLSRLANIFGIPNFSTTSSICYSPCALASKNTYVFMAYPDLSHPPCCIVHWGFNPRHTHPPLYRDWDNETSQNPCVRVGLLNIKAVPEW